MTGGPQAEFPLTLPSPALGRGKKVQTASPTLPSPALGRGKKGTNRLPPPWTLRISSRHLSLELLEAGFSQPGSGLDDLAPHPEPQQTLHRVGTIASQTRFAQLRRGLSGPPKAHVSGARANTFDRTVSPDLLSPPGLAESSQLLTLLQVTRLQGSGRAALSTPPGRTRVNNRFSQGGIPQ